MTIGYMLPDREYLRTLYVYLTSVCSREHCNDSFAKLACISYEMVGQHAHRLSKIITPRGTFMS